VSGRLAGAAVLVEQLGQAPGAVAVRGEDVAGGHRVGSSSGGSTRKRSYCLWLGIVDLVRVEPAPAAATGDENDPPLCGSGSSLSFSYFDPTIEQR
jgi:hypothetical protein